MASVSASAAEPTITFNRDVRPILSDACFSCHGPDVRKMKGGFRFDDEKSAKGAAKSGAKPIVPGDVKASELLVRVVATDESHMPPVESGKKLTPEQISTLRKWIEQGAKWEDHWAFQPIARPALPVVQGPVFIKHPVDRFIAVKLREQGLVSGPEADRVTLIRRLSFDLTGLPPSPKEVDDFVNDAEPNAYDKVVNRLLESPHYGERMAMFWLDLARYADSVGYHGDQPVSVWPFRDYVIRSFNTNKPFDQFTIEQLAGDLLPNPTPEQKAASGYNRLGMMSSEGGVQPKEYLAKYIAERVRAVGGAWLGLTTGCAECHDHKFDPISTRDFYRLEAFFADIQEQGLYGGDSWGSNMRIATAEQQKEIAELDSFIKSAQEIMRSAAEVSYASAQFKDWEKTTAADVKTAKDVKDTLAKPRAERTADEKRKLFELYAKTAPSLAGLRAVIADYEKQKSEILKRTPSTLITVAVPPREIRVLKRGNWQDTTGEVVVPGIPSSLPQPPKKEHGARLTRLDLANWIVAKENPLTSRVLVNRLWKVYFGTAFSRKLDDVGSQGESPTHPELLDYLAGKLIDSGWDIKAFVRLVVTSDAYKRTSTVDAATREKDPFNIWLARQGRWRLDAELVRDNALAVSGLLSTRIGGASAKPYQPRGYWSFLNFPKREWQDDTGDDLYRRGLYTHWQRQYLHPALLAFDAPSREECTADRVRSNTPLQSLVLLNAPEFVEAARVFAEDVLKKGGVSPETRLDYAFRKAVSRTARAQEKELLLGMLARHRENFTRDPAATRELLTTGSRAFDAKLDAAELAAWTSLTRTILNLHASVTRN